MRLTTEQIERRICRRLILDGLAAGYTISLHDGQEVVVKEAKTCRAVLEEMFSVADEHLLFHKGGRQVGWVYLVHGNGRDVISDHTTNLQPITVGAQAIADSL